MIFSELVHEQDLKEKSTAYLSGLVRKTIFRLPVEVEFVPRRRRAFYVIYAFLSGLYGYLLLSFLMVFTFHILQSYTPEWAFVPALAAGYWVFKGRDTHAGEIYENCLPGQERKNEGLAYGGARYGSFHGGPAGRFFYRYGPDFIEGRFVLEPARKALVRAGVAGTVTRFWPRKGKLWPPARLWSNSEICRLESAAAGAEC